jgi:hypothetical protein
LRREYDLSLASRFPDSKAVNRALRALAEAAEVVKPRKRRNVG